MKTKFITLAIATILLSGMVMAATLSRTVPSTVNPGDTFTVTYTASGVPAGKWFVAWEDSVSGGCTPTSGGLPISGFTASEIGESISKTLTAPSSGSCTFTGFYQFTDGSQVNFPSATITISGVCTPNCAGKSCGDDGCGGSCGTCSSGYTCNVNGQCVSSSQTCSQLGGDICTTDETCPGTWLSASDSDKCCSSTCTSEDDDDDDDGVDLCAIPIKIDNTLKLKIVDDPCTNGVILLGIGILFIVIIIGKL